MSTKFPGQIKIPRNVWLRSGSVVECMFSMHRTLGSISSIKKKYKKFPTFDESPYW
jgi:hypothetical protein